jgi:small subunit ribosomal protein S16
MPVKAGFCFGRGITILDRRESVNRNPSINGPSPVWILKNPRRTFMSARIRLKKFGTKKRPYYRIVVMDKRAPRDGKTIEELGYYHPIEAEDKQILFDPDKVKSWLQNGATVSDTVRRILNKKNFSL